MVSLAKQQAPRLIILSRRAIDRSSNEVQWNPLQTNSIKLNMYAAMSQPTGLASAIGLLQGEEGISGIVANKEFMDSFIV